MKSLRDKVRERAAAHKTKGGGSVRLPEGVERFVPEKGTVRVDILPYRITVDTNPAAKKGEVWYERTIGTHFGIGPEEQTFLCPSTIKQPCPICAEFKRLQKDPGITEDQLEEAKKAMLKKERQLFNVVLPDEDPNKIMVWEISYHLFGKQLEEELLQGSEENADFANLQGGKTLVLRFSEKKIGTNKFLEVDRIDFEDRDDYEDAWLDSVVDLDACLQVPTYKELEAAFNGDAGGDDAVTVAVGDRVSWTYRDAEHVGEVVELEKSGAIRVKDEADGKTKFLNEGDFALVTDEGTDDPDTPPEEEEEAPAAPPKRVARRPAPAAEPAPKAPPAKVGGRRRVIED